MKKTEPTTQLDIMTVLRETCHLPEQQLLTLQVCTFQAIRETIIKACNDGRIYKVHLLFIGINSDAGDELKDEIIDLVIEKISQEITISPLLIERTAKQTSEEALNFIAENFKQNSLNSILNYFKITQTLVGGVARYN